MMCIWFTGLWQSSMNKITSHNTSTAYYYTCFVNIVRVVMMMSFFCLLLFRKYSTTGNGHWSCRLNNNDVYHFEMIWVLRWLNIHTLMYVGNLTGSKYNSLGFLPETQQPWCKGLLEPRVCEVHYSSLNINGSIHLHWDHVEKINLCSELVSELS